MKTKLFTLFVALVATTALWASNTITYTATEKLPEVYGDDFVYGLHINAFNIAIISHEFSAGVGTITFDGEVTTVGNYAFYDCSRLTSISIPNSVTTIGEYAFSKCKSLTSITIPNSVVTIGKGALGYSGLNSIIVEASNTRYCVMDGVLFNYDKDSLIQYPISNTRTEYIIPNSVTTIGDAAFGDCISLTSVTIPNSVTTIGEYAFYDCINLKEVNGYKNVIEVGNLAFKNTLWFTNQPNGVHYIGKVVYKYKGNMPKNTQITIKDGILAISPYAFDGCFGLTSITIPNSVVTIGEAAFQWCSGLTSVTIPNSVITIGAGAFFKCTGLTSPLYNTNIFAYIPESHKGAYTIPTGIKQIAGGAFERCTGLTSVTIPNSVTTIGNSAFYNCSGLTSITIPNSVTTIGDWAFYMCTGLTFVTIGNSVTTIGRSSFSYCTSLTSITIPNSVTTIGNNAFWDCSGLTSVTIPNSVKKIGENAFAYCSGLTSIDISNSVTTIGYGAFAECASLTSIISYAVTPPECGDYAFYNISQDAKVYVPASALTDYQNAYGWEDMQLFPIAADITPMDDENPIVTPSDQDVTITWPITDGTDTYTLTITKNGEVVCVLTFNANGQLTNIAFAAPGHNDAHQAPAATLTAQGYRFTVTGLNPGTAYDYSVTATDTGGETLAEHKGNFSTTGGTGFESVHDSQCTMHKYFLNGNLIIERNGVKYTPAGQKVQ